MTLEEEIKDIIFENSPITKAVHENGSGTMGIEDLLSVYLIIIGKDKFKELKHQLVMLIKSRSTEALTSDCNLIRELAISVVNNDT